MSVSKSILKRIIGVQCNLYCPISDITNEEIEGKIRDGVSHPDS